MTLHPATVTGLRLGVYQAHALAGPPLAVVAFLYGPLWLALILAFGTGLGWAGWYRDFRLRWRPPPPTPPMWVYSYSEPDPEALTENGACRVLGHDWDDPDAPVATCTDCGTVRRLRAHFDWRTPR